MAGLAVVLRGFAADFAYCSATHNPAATNAATGQSTTPNAATAASPPHHSTRPAVLLGILTAGMCSPPR